MKYLITALAATLIMAVGGGRADAQQASVTPGSASGTENETLEFTISGSWKLRRRGRVLHRRRHRDAGGSDYMPLDSWRFCIEGTETTDRPTDYCEFGGAEESQTAPVVHYRDEVEESSETYRVVARVLRWETGELDADGVPVIRECGSGSCGRATATGTIIDSTEPPEPEEAGGRRRGAYIRPDEGGRRRRSHAAGRNHIV